MHKPFPFTALTIAITVAMTVLCCSDVLAQERPLDARLLLQTRKLDERALPESARKDAGGIVSSLKEHHISVQIFDIIKYLEEKRGKIPLYTALENKLSIELGLFGYLGVRWRF
jgi:hypothetical protein